MNDGLQPIFDFLFMAMIFGPAATLLVALLLVVI